jgi:hypothetical protein
MGENPFGPSPKARESEKRDADDWSYRPRNAEKYLREDWGTLRDVVFSYLTMGETEFKIWWKLEKAGDKERYFIGILWRNKRENGRPKKPAESPDLEHKLVGFGLQNLFGSMLARLD